MRTRVPNRVQTVRPPLTLRRSFTAQVRALPDDTALMMTVPLAFVLAHFMKYNMIRQGLEPKDLLTKDVVFAWEKAAADAAQTRAAATRLAAEYYNVYPME